MNISRKFELRDLDLNLLVVFQQLLRDRCVSVAAESLHLSQPTVSNALKRLRTLLGDELFVRTSRGMRPTPYAEELGGPIGNALTEIYETLNRQSSFDPATSDRHFVIALADVGEIYFLPPLMGALAIAAPRATVDTVSNQKATLREDMEQGKVDLAIGFLPDLTTDIYQRRLFRQRYVCLFREGHPQDKQEFTIDDFARSEHVVVQSGRGHAMINEQIERNVPNRSVKLTVPHFVALPRILQATDLIATVPEKIAGCLAPPFGLRFVPHPVKLPDFQINLFWHARFHHEPANQWLRNLVGERFAE